MQIKKSGSFSNKFLYIIENRIVGFIDRISDTQKQVNIDMSKKSQKQRKARSKKQEARSRNVDVICYC